MAIEFKKINQLERYIMHADRPIGVATVKAERIFHITVQLPTPEKLRAIADKLDQLNGAEE